jgi:hypothetical protein
MLEHAKEVKVVIFLEKARNPFEGNLERFESSSDSRSSNGNLEIWRSRALRSPWKLVMWSDSRLGNLWNRVGMNGSVESDIVKESRRRLVMERNRLQARERYSV